MKNKLKKAISFTLVMAVVFSALSGLFAVPVSAFDLSQEYEVSWDYVLTDEEGRSFTWYGGISASSNVFGHTYRDTAHTIHDYTVKKSGLSGSKSDWEYDEDYLYCFCIEPGVPLPDYTDYKGSNSPTHGDKWERLNENQRHMIMLALTYGYPNRRVTTSKEANACYSATQVLVWLSALGWMESPTQINDRSYPSAGYNGGMVAQLTANPYFKHFYDAILADMAKHDKRPSFTSGFQSSAPVYELTKSGGQYKLQLTDTNNVLDGYYVSASGGVSASISGNVLTLMSNTPITSEVTITLRRDLPQTGFTTGFLVWSVPGHEPSNQDMVSGVASDPMPSFLKLKVNTGNVKIIKTSEDGVVGNIPFTVTGNGVHQTVRTTAAGEILIENLVAGIYTVTEGTIDRYQPQGSRQVTVVSGQTSTVTFSNVLKRGDLQVIKSSEDHYIQGHTFRLSGTSLSGLAVDMYAVTDQQGVAVFKDVLISGSAPYVLEEVDTAIRYVIPPDQTAAVRWNEVTKANFTNTLKKFRVTVTKRDSEFPYPQGLAKLEGAVYGLYDGTNLIASYTTDRNGQFTTDYFACGDNWTIQEISPSEGYLLDTTAYLVGAEARLYTVEYNTAPGVTSPETVKKGRIQVIKHSDDGSTQIETPEAGAAFELYLEEAGSYDAARPAERDILICDQNGITVSKRLPYGIYRVRQLSGRPGTEKIRDFLVYVSEDGKTYPYIINNSAITSKLKIEKRNAEDGELIAAAGIGFMVKDPDGNLITQRVAYPTPTDISVFYTNPEGWLMLPQELEWGYGYQLIEVQTAPGFCLSDEPVTFDVTGETAFITVTKYNAPQKARIHIDKRGEVFSSVTFADGLYRPQYAVQSLAGAVYDIYADEDIYLNNKLMVAKDTRVAALTTTASGATSPLLYLGRYRAEERQAPYGMTSGQLGPKFVELAYRGQTVSEYTENVTFYNDRQKVRISFEKAMEQDWLYQIGMNGEIAAVRMGLYADADMIAADGKKIPKDGLIEIVPVDTSTGSGEFTVDLPVGSRVYLKEYATGNAYILGSEKYPLAFEYAGQDVPLVELSANSGKPVENKIKRGSVEGLKVDENGKGLAGALIGLFAPGTAEYTEENVLLTNISGDNGAFSFAGVAYGEWVCREIAAPGAAYVLDETVYPVTVSGDRQIIQVTVTNRFVRGDIKGLKLDEDGQGLEGALIGLFYPDETEFIKENAVMTALSAENGNFAFEGVLYGNWLVREIAAPGAAYVLDETVYPVTVSYHKQVVSVEITDIYVRGSVKGLKLDEDNKGLAGAVIGLFCPDETAFTTDNAVMVTQSGKRGRFAFDGILYGDWIVREIAPPRAFVLSEVSYPVTIGRHKQVIRVVISNTLIRGSVEGVKLDEDGNGLAGALIGLFRPGETEFTADNAAMTDRSAEDGSFVFTEVVFGDWIVREIAPPSAAYVLSGQSYPVTIARDQETVRIEIENRLVRGSVRVTKVDAEYPGNKLSGAVFDVYEDTNGNKEFDGDVDLLAGTLEETGAGIYQLDGLTYAGYFLRERTAPDNFLPDGNDYYFEILVDGEIVDVENLTGTGFVNRPAYGELWLTKKDVSTGELIPNCGIRIKDENGNMIVEGRTDENGVAKFRLRAGRYTYSEFDCPGYVLDESEYPFEITGDGQIIKAEMTNKKIPEPEIPENPKTGDDSNPILWFMLMGASVAGLILTLRRRKKAFGAR